MSKCKNCVNLRYNWCEKVSDSPDENMERECVHFRQMTNADRIRSMTDEELAWELMTWRCEAVAKYHGVESQYPDTQKAILSRLQQTAKGE